MKQSIRLTLMVATILIVATSSLLAQDKISGPTLSQQFTIPDGSRVFISAMEGKLEGFIAAELVKKKLPIVVVIDDKDADFIIAGGSIKGDDKWFHSVFGGKDKNEANIHIISVKTKTVIWAGEAGDRSLWWGNVRRGGQRRVADRLVDKMKKDLFRR